SARFHLPTDIPDVREMQDVNGRVLVVTDVDECDDDLLSGVVSCEVETVVPF
ncbi:hypothetical protein HYDPIDRAFT_109147, partial [Hydnomerulius pinastri MD-312]